MNVLFVSIIIKHIQTLKKQVLRYIHLSFQSQKDTVLEESVVIATKELDK